MASTRVEVRYYERTNVPQDGWLYFAADQAVAALLPAFDHALRDVWVWPRRSAFVTVDQPQDGWIFSGIPVAAGGTHPGWIADGGWW